MMISLLSAGVAVDRESVSWWSRDLLTYETTGSRYLQKLLQTVYTPSKSVEQGFGCLDSLSPSHSLSNGTLAHKTVPAFTGTESNNNWLIAVYQTPSHDSDR